ncbi:tRNA (adenine(22)-N(1))-methyltransferase [Pseudoneobacillus sp. C159]
MNTEKLSARLSLVADYIPKGSRIADIGSDHAYLPCYLVKKGLVPFAIAGEVVEGPFQSAKRQVMEDGLSEYVSVRKGNGLEVVSVGEVDCITIAGMGGTLISTILEAGKEKLSSVARLILQPNISAISIRQWLMENDWELIGEEIIEEDQKIYEVLIAEKGEPNRPYTSGLQTGLLMGPFLIEKKSDVFIKKWVEEKRNWERILRQLTDAFQSDDIRKKKEELETKIKMVEEVLNT